MTRKKKIILSVLGVLFLAGAGLVLAMPYCGQSAGRQMATSMLSCSLYLKEVAETKTVSNADLPESCINAISQVEPLPGGGLHLTNEEFGIELLLTPNPDGSTTWHCVGTPEKHVPVYCRAAYRKSLKGNPPATAQP